ncbi:NAD-dependent epimerase/dehydratase family protein [Methylophilaceae bacterium]|nr:NAD-dependent epimerase/dehydratase family protein [Methylophilaceae bacterium]
MNVLVVGATGFIGRRFVKKLLFNKFNVKITTRKEIINMPNQVTQFVGIDLLQKIDWRSMLEGVDVVVYLAGKVNIMSRNADNLLQRYQKINCDAALDLAREMKNKEVKRFIYLSSIGVNGDITEKPFTETDIPNPFNTYAISKYDAEVALFKLKDQSNIEVTVIRAPLVYGPNAPGNFGSLIRWASKNFILPLPLDKINNARSFIALDNLVDFIFLCMKHPKAANELFLISDENSISTTQLLIKITNAFKKKPNLFFVPIKVMLFFAKLIGKVYVANSLFGSLEVDSSKAKKLLSWKPSVTMEEQLREIAHVHKKDF